MPDTPLYDILSTYPVQGRGANRMDPRKARLAMAVTGENRHYLLHDIHRWHWVGMAERLGLPDGAEPIINGLVERAPEALHAVAKRLPQGFPSELFDSVNAGVMVAAKRLGREPDRRSTGGRGAGSTRAH